MKSLINKITELKNFDYGASEIIGTIILFGIVVTFFSSLYFIVLSEQFETEEPYQNIVASVDGNYITIQHRGGEDLSAYTKIIANNGTGVLTLIDINHENLRHEDLNGDGKWNIGEKLWYNNFNYNYSNNLYNTTSIDEKENRIILDGTLDAYPETDLAVEITIDNLKPKINDSINITIHVYNLMGYEAEGVKIKYLLPEALKYITHRPNSYDYNNFTGIWDINEIIERHSFINMTIEVRVSETMRITKPTQLAMILDGSGSISSDNWNLMKTGLSNAISDPDILPHDESVELTIVQFGDVNPPNARIELGGPVYVNSSNYQDIANDILNITQMVNQYHSGATPMGCGIRRAADLLYYTGNYSNSKRQIINLVTDGLPNCEWNPGGYSGTWLGNGWENSTYYSHSGLLSAYTSSSNNGDFFCKDLNTLGVSNINIEFWYRLQNTENNDLSLYYYDGYNYDYITSLGGNSENNWNYYSDTISNSKYFIENFSIKFDSSTSSGESIWIDDIIIKTDTILLNDSFETEPWNLNWSSTGKKSAENARKYLINLLQLEEENDELDSLAVGPGPDIHWLMNKIVWPQPGYIVPPFTDTPGWVSKIDTWQEFENAINEMFIIQFSGIETSVEILNLAPRDPFSDNNIFSATIIPEEI